MGLTRDVVVTGGAGAIGSNLVRRLLKDSEVRRIIVIDDLSGGYRWLVPEDPRVELLECDVANRMLFDTLGRRTLPIGATVYHLAAHFANARSWDEPELDTRTNVLGTVNMLELAYLIDSPLFVFASAGCAAGHEDSPYQVSKTAGEAYCRCYFHKVPSAVFRFMNAYGEGELPGEYRNVIPRMVWSVMNDEPITIFGNGSDGRDFVHYDDVCEQLVRASPSTRPQEVGTGYLTSISTLTREVCAALGKPDHPVKYAARRRWDHAGRAATVARYKHVELTEGLRRTVEWFRTNEARIRESL
jgi:nucleoside-diphosphate-sugar epimerase